MPKDYYGRDYSDDEHSSRGREKFRRERSPEKDDFGRDKRRRKTSASPDDRERRPRRNRSSSKDGDDDPGDRYIPNYERDGYNPAPRYGRPDHYSSRYDGPGGYGDYRGQRRRDDYGDMDGADMPYGDMPPNWGPERMEDPMKLDHLISFKQFCDYLRSADRASHRFKRYTDEELQARYGTYKEDFTSKQYTSFFDAHKAEAWFLEKYHPDFAKTRTDESRTLRRARYSKFIEELEAGKYDNTTCDEAVAKKQGDVKSDKADGTAETANAVDKDGDTKVSEESDTESWLYLRNVLPNVSRESIMERCNKLDSFLMLSLSEPHPLKDLQRIGWIKLKAGTDLQEAVKTLSEPLTDDFLVVTTPHRPTRARYTHEIANTEARIHADLELAVELAKICDSSLTNPEEEEDEAEEVVYDGVSLVQARLRDVILENVDASMEEGNQEDAAQATIRRANERRSLDLMIEYLRQVHLFCYYCGGDSDNVEEFARKCSKHYRNADSKTSVSSKGPIWVKNLEQKLNLKLRPPSDEEIVKLGGKSYEKGIFKFMQGKTQQDEATKWRCKICTKPFRGEEFVHKHIRVKHPEEVKTVENNILLFNNYILDPNHINPSAQQQQSQPTGYGFSMPGPVFGGPPMPMSFMPTHPMGMPFMATFPPGFMPPSFGAAGAMAGTPMDQIPRIGFDLTKRRGSGSEAADKAKATRTDVVPTRPPNMMLDPRSRMSDPRKVKSYVDLDAPAEGDLDSKYNLW